LLFWICTRETGRCGVANDIRGSVFLIIIWSGRCDRRTAAGGGPPSFPAVNRSARLWGGVMATQPGTTEESPPQRPKNPFNSRAVKPVDPVVFSVALGIILVFVVLGALFPDTTGEIASSSLNWVIVNLGWLFILGVAFFVAF